jgi:hypothetical protein
MRTLLLLFSFLVLGSSDVLGQATAPAPPTSPAPGTAKPPVRRAAPPANARGGMAITVTDPRGATLMGIRVEAMGPTDRSEETNASGQANFPGLQPGTYRLRFSGDEVISFEREVAIRAGQIADVDVSLNPAPPPRVVEVATPVTTQPAEAPPPPAPPVGPTGMPQTLSVPDLLEKNFVGSQPRRETVLSCSVNTRSMMIQLNAALPERLYESADATYYVIGGEGVVRIAGRETKLVTNGFVSVPRGTSHAFVRAGRRPLILLAVLSGEPCEEAK